MDEQLYRAFAAIEDHHWWFVARRRILGDLVRTWVPEGGTVLDVGCGTGGFVSDLGKYYYARGVDPSPLALDACRNRGLTTIIEGTATDEASWGDLPVNAVTLLDVIEHLDDDVAALRAARTAVAPDGHVIVTVPAYQWLWSSHDTVNQHRRRYTTRALLDAHRRAGLRPLQAGYFNSLLFPIALVQRLLASAGIGSNALAIPARPVNALFRTVFTLERLVLRKHGHFPAGLSAFCVSTPSF